MSYEPPSVGGYRVVLWAVALLAVTGCVSKRVVPDAANGKRILLPTPVALSPPVVVTFVDGVAAIPLVGWFKVARDSKQAEAVGAMLSATGLDVPTEFARHFSRNSARKA